MYAIYRPTSVGEATGILRIWECAQTQIALLSHASSIRERGWGSAGGICSDVWHAARNDH